MESILQSILTGICPRVYPDYAPLKTQRPYITWQQIGGTPISMLSRDIPDIRNSLVQINVWSNTKKESSELAWNIERALRNSNDLVVNPQSEPTSSFDEDLGLRGTMQDFNIWSRRTV